MRQRLPLLLSLGFVLVLLLPASAATKPKHALPPVPAAARDDLMNASEVIAMLMRRPDKAARSGEWDVVIDRLNKAQAKAPEAPQILMDLGLAHEMRGRNLAAISWFTAAWWATTRVDIHLPQVAELHKRISTLNRKVGDEVELLLRFAKDQVPYLHATTPPRREWEDPGLFPPTTVVLGDHYEQLPNGQSQLVRPLTPEVSKQRLEAYLLELELSMGYEKALPDTLEYGRRYYPNDQAILDQAHYKAFQALLGAMTEVEDWAGVSSLASAARRWAEDHGSDPGGFEKSRLEATQKLGEEKPDTKLAQWIALAKQQSGSDDEILLDATVETLRRGANKDASVLEAIAKALRPIAHERQRQAAVTSIYSVGSWD
jgi:hypothetical protein